MADVFATMATRPRTFPLRQLTDVEVRRPCNLGGGEMRSEKCQYRSVHCQTDTNFIAGETRRRAPVGFGISPYRHYFKKHKMSCVSSALENTQRLWIGCDDQHLRGSFHAKSLAD